MGWSFALAGFRDPQAVAVGGVETLARVGLGHQSSFEGWRFGSGRSTGGWRAEALASELARDTSQPAIAAWLFDSDTAYLAVAEPGGEQSVWLAIGEAESAYEDESDDPNIEEIRRHNAHWHSPEDRDRAAEDLAAWSKRWAPSPVTAPVVINSWRDEDEPGAGPVLMEEALYEIFTGMGLPPPGLITG
jgi:hypothetical protein